MYGLLMGELPGPTVPLGHLRRQREAKATLRGYIDPKGPVLSAPLAALKAGRSFAEFAAQAWRLFSYDGFFASAPIMADSGGLILSEIEGFVRNCQSEKPSPYQSGNTQTVAAILRHPEAKALGEAVWGALGRVSVHDSIKSLLPPVLTHEAVTEGTVSALSSAGGFKYQIADEIPGALRLAVTLLRGPPELGSAAFVSISLNSHGTRRAGASWFDERAAREIFSFRDEGALIERARMAAERETQVHTPSHECLPETYSLLIPKTRQEIFDDETDLLAVDFLLEPLGLSPPEDRGEQDWLRPLTPGEADSIRRRLKELNQLAPEELFSQARRFLLPEYAGAEDGGYAGELQGMIHERLEKFFGRSAKKNERITLVACNDWLGDKKE